MSEYHVKNMNETIEKGDYESLLEGNVQLQTFGIRENMIKKWKNKMNDASVAMIDRRILKLKQKVNKYCKSDADSTKCATIKGEILKLKAYRKANLMRKGSRE
nr:hypothetical protein [Nanoarchaeota archaeon]